jgi:Mrp family chromosome partitioning ATPase
VAEPDQLAISVLVLTGPVGVGKSTVAQALAALMERAALEDLLVETDRRTPAELARAILVASGWDADPPAE